MFLPLHPQRSNFANSFLFVCLFLFLYYEVCLSIFFDFKSQKLGAQKLSFLFLKQTNKTNKQKHFFIEKWE